MNRDRAAARHAAIVAFVHDLVEVSLNRQLHAPDKDFVQESLRRLIDSLHHCEELGVEMPLQLQLDDRMLHYDGLPLEGPSLQAAHLLRQCRDRGVAMLSFRPQLNVEEANRAFDLLLLDHNRDALRREQRDQALKAFGIRNVGFTLNTPADPTNRRSVYHLGDRTASAVHHYQDLAEALQTNHMLAFRDLDLAIDEAAGVVERTLADFEEPSTLLALAAQDDVDRFTVGHSVRVALLALQVSRHLGLDREQLISIGTAALMHDIGKSKVPQEILFKRGHLDEEEWRMMSQHPRLGAQLLLEQHASIDPCTIGAAFCHHMGPHGHGYPRPALPILPSGTSHLIRVCDVFEALTSVRPYKKALTPLEAFAVMFRNPADFEPDWLRKFARTIGMFPTGTRVMLDDGADGVVLAQSNDPSKPIVRLLAGADGTHLADNEPDRIVVGTEIAGKTRRIIAISTHDRVVDVPDFTAAPAPSTPHACLSEQLARDAQRVGAPKTAG
ncbi:MAG: HD domain-containing protein [Planctomycetes bacterium]|nr:HD domain-containing protein [Planctomycetota bacterium]